MTAFFFLEHSVSVAVVITLAVGRRRSKRVRPLPESAKLGGVSLRRLLDEPCGPGAVLRDMLTHHPPNHH